MRTCAARCGNAYQLAKRSGIGMSTLSRYFSGSEPTRQMLVAVADAAKVPIEWLATGHGPTVSTELASDSVDPTQSNLEQESKRQPDDEFIKLSLIVGSDMDQTGNRTLVFDDVRAFIPRAWLTVGLRGASPDNLAAYVSNGSYMEPEILDGEMLIIDISPGPRAPAEGRRLVRIYDEICVRYIHRINRDTFLVTHANVPRGFEGIRFNREDLGKDVDILGKIILGVRFPSEGKQPKAP